jgi:hypothetical protein
VQTYCDYLAITISKYKKIFKLALYGDYSQATVSRVKISAIALMKMNVEAIVFDCKVQICGNLASIRVIKPQLR